MYNSKQDVDRLVRSHFAKLSENEKNLRGFIVAKQYFKIGEYKSACQYLYNYLSVQEDNAAAHKLLGHCYEKLSKPDKAIASFQRSLQLDSKQTDVVLSLCNLFLSDDLGNNSNKIKNLIDLAENEGIRHETFLNLKLKYLNLDKSEPSLTHDILIKEIVAQPTIPSLRIRLLKNLLEQNRIVEAFKYAYDFEMKGNENLNSIDWYNMLGKVIKTYKLKEVSSSTNWDLWLLSIIALEKQIYLNLCFESNNTSSQNHNVNEITGLLIEFDELLHAASVAVFDVCKERELAVQFLSHFRGQFCLHATSLMFLREKCLNKNQWKETISYSIPLLLLSLQCGIPDTQESWIKLTGENTRNLIQLWNRQGAFRCSQAGRTILSCVQLETFLNVGHDKVMFQSNDELLDRTRKFCYDESWRKNVYRYMFNIKGPEVSSRNSYFLNSNLLKEPIYEIPSHATIETYEEIAQWLYPSSLQYLTYIGLGILNLHDLRCHPFAGLNFSNTNLTNCTADSLNQLDMECYLYASIIQARRALELEKFNRAQYYANSIPLILPFANMGGNLCTEEQSEWWTAAFNLSRNIPSDEFGKLRLVIQHGLEAIRGVDAPKINVYIILEMGKILSYRAQKNLKPNQKEFLDNRAETLYKHGLHMIKLKSKGNSDFQCRYFRYPEYNNDLALKINTLAESAVAFLAKKYFNAAEYEECIQELSDLHLPYAVYFQAEAYKLLDKSEKTPLKSKKLYIEKAQDCINKTIRFLNDPNIEKNHPLRSIIEQEKRRLTFSTETDFSNGYQENVDTEKGDEISNAKYEDILNKVADIQSLFKQINENFNFVKDDLFNIKTEIIDVQAKLAELLSRKNSTSLRDEEAQALEHMFEEELQNQALASSTASFNARNIIPLGLQTPNTLAYSQMLQQHTQPIPPPNLYNSPMYNTNYPMYHLYPFQNLPQPPLLQQHAAKITPNKNWTSPQLPELSPQLTDPRFFMTNQTITNSIPSMSTQQFAGNNQKSTGYDISSIQLQDNIPSAMVNDMTGPSFLKSMYPYNNLPIEKAPPVNVVITSSDPLPTQNTITIQPSMSVTIPQCHIKNSNQTLNTHDLPNPNVFSNITTKSESHLTFPPPELSTPSKLNENELLCSSVKFFKYINGEWKEQANGPLRLLKDGDQVLLTMTNEQTSTIIAKHHILPKTPIHQSKPNLKVYSWSVAEQLDPTVINKYCARFANQEIAKQFYNEFTKAKKLLSEHQPQMPDDSISSESIKVTPATSINTLGGFTFKAPVYTAPVPTLSKPVEEEKPPKSSLFTNFSFGLSKPTDNTFAGIFNTQSTNPSSLMFSNPSQDLSMNKPPAPESLNKSTENVDDDYEPTIQFQPVIPLPDIIEVKTGEEDEIIAFEHRAKLLRFDNQLKEWKERGIGNIKVLIHKNDPNKVRLLMRREQVLKLCCNQSLTKNTEFKNLPKLETGVFWSGVDYSENELKDEILAVRFKTVETCKQFVNVITEAQKNMTANVEGVTEEKPKPKTEVATGFGDKFKAKPGSWNCESCYTTNKSDSIHCVACLSPKDSSVPKKEENSLVPNPTSTFSFGSQSNTTFSFGTPTNIKPPEKGFGDKFNTKPGSWACNSCYISNKVGDPNCVACQTPRDGTLATKPIDFAVSLATPQSFTFGVQPGGFKVTPSATKFPESTTFNSSSSSTFLFGKQVSPPKTISSPLPTNNKFGFTESLNLTTTSLNSKSQTITSFEPKAIENDDKTNSEGFKFDTKKSFDFVFKPKSPGKVKSPIKEHPEVDEESEEEVDEEENNTYFTPVIPLPDKVDVKTGEESEELLYVHRAKLFRFIDGEWKERGLGDVKLLKHKDTGKLRVVMRREQVLKICLNHVLTSDIEYNPKDDKSWHFIVNDFSEGVLEVMNFCLRFKNHEVSEDFMKAIKSALDKEDNGLKVHTQNDEIITKTKESKSVSNPVNDFSKEDKELIQKLKLPYNFYEYRNLPDCKGCRGCNSEDFVFPVVDKNINKDILEEETSLPNVFVSLNLDNIPTTIFNNKLNNLSSTEKDNSLTGNIFGGQSAFLPKSGQTNIFGKQSFAANTTPFSFSTELIKNDSVTSQNSFKQSTNISVFGSTTNENEKIIVSKDNDNVSEEDNEKAEKNALSKFPTTIFGKNLIFEGKTIEGSKQPDRKDIETFSEEDNEKEEKNTITNNELTKSSVLRPPTFSFISAAKELETKTNDDKKESTFVFPAFGSGDSKPIFGSKPFAFDAANKSKQNSELLISKEKQATFPEPVFKTSDSLGFENIARTEMFKTEGSLSFASLAASTNNSFGAPVTASAPTSGFFGLTNNEDFSRFSGARNKLNTSTDEDTSVVEDPSYDPHYEPVIALPDEIVVKTGEEDEVKLFGERSKLFRFDPNTKEWKERGVGELKILHHPSNGTYRLLLRREQIHKLVLNHAINLEFIFSPMNSSGNSYCWATLNYSEEHPDGQVESLAARFKNNDIAKRFENEVNNCLEQLKSRSDLEPEDD